MGIRAIDYEDLSEGDLITWYGVHVLRWEDEIRPYGIKPTVAFVQDDTLEKLNAELLEASKQAASYLCDDGDDKSIRDILMQAIAKAEGE